MDVVEAALADLRRSGIDSATAEYAGIYAVDDATELDASFKPLPALVIPYTDDFFRIRYLTGEPVKKRLGQKKPQRYAQLPGSGVRAYLPPAPGIDWTAIGADPKQPLIITEGEKKALAATSAGFKTIGLGGVFNWLSNGELLPELCAMEWRGRDVYICFDSDAAENSYILAAEARLALELSVKRGANVLRMRIPGSKTPGSSKVGLDDLLVAKGPDAIHKLAEAAKPLRSIDRAVLALNESVAWMERDGMVWDMDANMWLRKENFCNGSIHSTHVVMQPRADGIGVKPVYVAPEWLKNPLARRYEGIMFEPDGPAETEGENGMVYNMWTGYRTGPGDVTPWLRLNEYLMQKLPPELQDFTLHLLAYKAQNPASKIPIALVLVGPEGCGKSLWAMCLREAFSPYGLALSSSALLSEFNPWVEGSLLAVIDEAQAMHLTRGADTLKNLISEKRTTMRDLYRSPRQVDSYTMYILTANDRRVGSYSSGNRRMFVMDMPEPAADSLYTDAVGWLRSGMAPALMQYLLEYDLKGWKPPLKAPLTPEKYMAYIEGLTPVQRLADDMLTSTRSTIELWLDSAMEWALAAETTIQGAARAHEIKDVLGRIHVRPFFTANELMLIFPSMTGSLYGQERGVALTAGELSRQLRECGIPYLRCSDNPRGFSWKGRTQQFLIVSDQKKWDAPMTQAEFEAVMATFSEYRNL